MLISFHFENFKSFREGADLSLVAHKADKTIPGSLVDVDLGEGGQLRLLPAAAIYGPNAAGKTNVILAMDYMRIAIRDSQTSWLSSTGTRIVPFSGSKDPAKFEAEFVVQGVRYRYGFLVSKRRFVEEWLYAYPKRKERMLFERRTGSGDEEITVQYGPSFEGSEDDHEASRRRTRENSLYLSSCAQDNQPQARAITEWFRMKVTVVSTTQWFGDWGVNFTSRMCGDSALFKSRLEGLLRSADSSFDRVEVETPDDAGDDYDLENDPKIATEKFGKDNSKYKVSFVMKDAEGEITLPLSAQSRGLQKLYSIATSILFALEFGEVLFVDELEGSMHPHVAAQIVSLFQSTSTNTSGSQIVFTTHDTNFLDIGTMRRDQIWFVEKDASRSHLYGLLSFAPRKDENYQRGYLRGKYGAIPALGFFPDWAMEGLPDG